VPTLESQFCWGAFAAIQGLAAGTYNGAGVLQQICAPPKGTRIQMINIFSHYLNQHPEQAHLDFEGVAYCALMEAFPCPYIPKGGCIPREKRF
jgi:hypothetical protein